MIHYKRRNAFMLILILIKGQHVFIDNLTSEKRTAVTMVCTSHKGRSDCSKQVIRANGDDPVTDFDLFRCIWNGTRYNSCERNFQSVTEEISDWPNGPYALPMPVDGCPESSTKGWKRGYIDLTWQYSHVVVSWNQSERELDNHTNKFEQLKDVTRVQLPETQSPLLGPYGRYRIKLNFCFKIKRNETLDVGVWPDGNYNIYGVKTGCPYGFSSDITNITISKVSHTTYDGHLPEFKLYRSGHNSDYLEMRLCKLSMRSEPKPDKNMTNNYPFVLLQSRTAQIGIDSLQCPLVSGMDVTEQSLGLLSTDFPSNITELFRFCYFRPSKWKHSKISEEASIQEFDWFRVRSDETNGELTFNTREYVQRENIQIDTHQGIMELLASDLSHSTKIQWKLLDFGRTLSIYAVAITVTGDTHMNGELRCYHSNAKWDFLNFGAEVCSYTARRESVVVSRWEDFVAIERVALLMKRPVECRYMAFVDGSANKFSTMFSTEMKFTGVANLPQESANKNARCTIDLGMIDYGIDDFQISASTSLHNFPVHFARPFLSSWCASINDTSPWLLIDLQRAMRVEGISIWNREYVYETVNNGSIYKYILNLGVRSFNVSFGDSKDNMKLYNNQVFLLDTMHPVEKRQSFMFHFSFTAHFVKIHILEPLATSLSCLRFELHGCRKTSTKVLECQTSSVIKRVPALNNPSKSAERVYTDLTVNGCNDLCLDNTDCSIVNYFNNGSCLHYGPNHDKTWMLHSSGTNDRISSAKVCRSDYIELPYVAYTDKWDFGRIRNAKVLTFMSLVRDVAVLTSIGFPLNYVAGENYKWIINYDETEFIKLVFTNININEYMHDNVVFCQDKLLFNEEEPSLNSDPELIFTVDHSYNGHIFTIESGLSYMTLTFLTCQQYNAVIHKGNGFRVLVSKQETEACLSFENLRKSAEKRIEYCDRFSMSLYSMTFLNIPFAKRNETWIIHRKKGFLRIDIIEFDIECIDEKKFAIADRFAGEKTYCNLNRPPNVIHTASSSITVYFTSDPDTSDDFFHLVYTNIYETYETVQDLITSKGDDIPVIYQSIAYEAFITSDYETTALTLKDFTAKTQKNIPRLLYKVCSKRFGKCFTTYSYVGTWERAGSECWIRQQRLVSIRNADELKLIMYLMRNFKLLVDSDLQVFDSAFRHNNTDFYYTYIGLHRKDRGTDKNAFFWENKAPLTFSSWGSGQPSTGYCTRMGFYMANEDHSWETCSCLSNAAFYFICETPISSTSLGLEDRQFSYHYTGNVSVTLYGKTCQRWDSPYSQYSMRPNFNSDAFPDSTKTEAENFCRDPDRSFQLWCYTSEISQEICYINELKEDISPKTYLGKLDKIDDGGKCIKNTHCRHSTPYTRDLTNSDTYFSCIPYSSYDGYTRKLCNFIDTASDRCLYTHHSYAGAWNSTASGKRCERWDLFMAQEKIQEHQFPDKDLNESSNYCRDPTFKGFPWCYISYPEMVWEICVVEYGNDVLGNKEGDGLTPDEYFECKEGKLLDSFEHCNGVIDCVDASDETNCTDKAHPLLQRVRLEGDIEEVDRGLFYQCKSQEVISYLALCDGVIDCQDASDEINCTNDNGICSKDQFTCGDGSCIHLSLFCNFIRECSDASDEACDYPLCKRDEYTCENLQCIPNTKRCNAIIDCFDGTDENNCGQNLVGSDQNYEKPNVPESQIAGYLDTDTELLNDTESCASRTFHCDYVRCLPIRLQCDTYTDCEDDIDEWSCDMNDISSCMEWWKKGYRKSGMYKSDDLQMKLTDVYCEFSFVIQRHELFTVFLNMDSMQWNGDIALFTTFLGDKEYDEVIEFFFQTNGETVCTQEIVQSCVPTIQAASEIDFELYPYCNCLVVTLVIGWEAEMNAVRYCNDSEPLNEAEYGNKLLFEYKYAAQYRVIELKSRNINEDHIHLQIGNITCKESFMHSSDDFACGEGKFVYDASVRCVYDVDRADRMIGCRSGSHLQNCDEDCPNGTVKCPGSYCIPLRFVCDGIEQCPDAEDESECGCEDTDREVLIIHEETTDEGPEIMKLAKLLSTPNSIVRSIQYKSTLLSKGIPFIHKVLQIKDSEVSPSKLLDRNYKCVYTSLANQFLNSVRFTKQKGQSILFMQSSPESEIIAKLMFANITKTPNFALYRVMESPTSKSRANEFPFVIDITVKNWKIMSSLASRYLPKLCREAFSTSVPGSYKCSSSKMSITRDQVCDGRADCSYGDDELLCNFVCPDRCVCNGFAMSCKMNGLNSSYISLFSKQTRSLTISNVGEMEMSVIRNLLDFPFLYALNLSICKISEIQANAFVKVTNLRVLDISDNVITQLSSTVFNGLQQLQTLILDGNKHLSTLEPFTFQHLHSIKSLKIVSTNIRSIVSNTFAGLSLKHLNLQNNIFETVEEFGLGNLIVEHIDFESNVIATFDKGMFKGVSALKSLRSPAYKYCCVRPSYLPEDDCFPRKDEFSSCEDLMRISILQTMLWLIGLCALLGNILSVIYRLIFDRKRLKLGYGIFVTNLAVADFLMGIYLIIIAVADAVFRNRYIFMDDYWRNSSWCTFAGVLSTMSSEASVMFLCLITLDRLIVIKYPFGQVRINSKKAVNISLIVWIFCFIIAIFPLMYSAYFQNTFYNKSGVCIALPLTRDRPPGWLYSVMLFVGLNFVTFILIAIGQWSIYMDIRKSGKSLRKGQSARKKDLLVARNLLLVVATDFLCWFPIGCIGLMALSGRVISGDVYAWAAVFILPVNSALNPVLYTLTAILGKKSFTPRTDEQAKHKVPVALGKRFLVHKKIVTRRFYVDDDYSHDSYCMLGEAIKASETIAPDVMLKMSHQLIETLLLLHKNSLILNKIDEQSVYVKVKENKITGDVQLRHEPSICGKPSDIKNDMYKFGLFLSVLFQKSTMKQKMSSIELHD